MVIDGISRELVENARCGVYAEPENVVDIVEKIEWMASNKREVIAMGERGYHYAKEHFDRQVLAKNYISEIQSRLKLVQ
jgi:glycosyltransferase involved in cell wall biosynthesis